MVSSSNIAALLEQARKLKATFDDFAQKLADKGIINELPLLSPENAEGDRAKPTVSLLPTNSRCNYDHNEPQLASILPGTDAQKVIDKISDRNFDLDVVPAEKNDLVPNQTPEICYKNEVNEVFGSRSVCNFSDELPVPTFIKEMAEAAKITELDPVQGDSDTLYEDINESLANKQMFAKLGTLDSQTSQNLVVIGASREHFGKLLFETELCYPYQTPESQVKAVPFNMSREIHYLNFNKHVVFPVMLNDLDRFMGSNLSEYLDVKACSATVFELEIDRMTFLSFKELQSWGKLEVESTWMGGVNNVRKLHYVHYASCLFSVAFRDYRKCSTTLSATCIFMPNNFGRHQKSYIFVPISTSTLEDKGDFRGEEGITVAPFMHLGVQFSSVSPLLVMVCTRSHISCSFILHIIMSAVQDHDTPNVYICIDLYFVTQEGGYFKVKYNFQPYYFVDCITDLLEYDVPYHVRFCIDNDVRCGQWYDVSISNTGVVLDWRLDLLQRAEVHFCAFDIETTNLHLRNPDAKYDSIMMISFMVNGQGYLIINREFVGDDTEDLERTLRPEFEGCFIVTIVKNEKELLRSWFSDHMQEVKHGIFVTYNGDVFEWLFSERKAAEHGYKMSEEIGFQCDKVIPFIFPLATIIPLPPDEVLRKGSGTLCQMFLMVQTFNTNAICPNQHQSKPKKLYNSKVLVIMTFSSFPFDPGEWNYNPSIFKNAAVVSTDQHGSAIVVVWVFDPGGYYDLIGVPSFDTVNLNPCANDQELRKIEQLDCNLEDATWEFLYDLQLSYPKYDPWGQGSFQGEGNDASANKETGVQGNDRADALRNVSLQGSELQNESVTQLLGRADMEKNTQMMSAQ